MNKWIILIVVCITLVVGVLACEKWFLDKEEEILMSKILRTETVQNYRIHWIDQTNDDQCDFAVIMLDLDGRWIPYGEASCEDANSLWGTLEKNPDIEFKVEPEKK